MTIATLTHGAQKPESTGIDKNTLLFALFTTFAVTFPHINHVPGVIFGFFLICFGWRLASAAENVKLPSRSTLFVATLAGIGVIFWQHQTLLGLEAGTSFFVVCLGLKLLELRQDRDLYLVIYLSFFVATTLFLFSQSILMGIHVLIASCLLIVNLISINAVNAMNLKAKFKLSLTLLGQAFPIMILLFLIFPRIAAPKFGLGAQNAIGRTGLSDTLKPGQISQLIQSNALAFRVNFEGPIPPPNERYWRGPVFWYTDGEQWSLESRNLALETPVQPSSEDYEYTVTLEPHHQKWLFALDIPSEIPLEINQSSDLLLRANKSVVSRISYNLRSNTQYNTGSISSWEKQAGLQLPAPPSPRITRLIDEWQKKDSKPTAIVQQALEYFHNNAFFYTLLPPLYRNKPIETFLFEARKGFCEHYATAFVYLMRAANIPSRIITGYQGGEYNTVGNFLEIRQSDAHAWAEVWLEGKGWVRFDPTSAISPERIDRDIDRFSQRTYGYSHFGGVEIPVVSKLIQNIQYAWLATEHAWYRQVIAYNADRQNSLMSAWGIGKLADRILSLIASIAVLLLLVAAVILYKRPAKSDKAKVLYHRFCRKLSRHGLVKAHTEGARNFARRATIALPSLEFEINEITQVYQTVRYARTSNNHDLKQLCKLVNQFRA